MQRTNLNLSNNLVFVHVREPLNRSLAEYVAEV